MDRLESSTGERERAAGTAFLVIFKVTSCDFLEVLIIEGIGGAFVVGLFTVEYLLLDEFGTLKLGVAGEWLRTVRAGPTYVECRYVFGGC
jgi:hypothetical protein